MYSQLARSEHRRRNTKSVGSGCAHHTREPIGVSEARPRGLAPFVHTPEHNITQLLYRRRPESVSLDWRPHITRSPPVLLSPLTNQMLVIILCNEFSELAHAGHQLVLIYHTLCLSFYVKSILIVYEATRLT